ncbi:leucine-rich repeat domain-containing protein [Aestuariibacter halophilus]|uniref:Leucine-rich repeat domain-containing protein n=1 Tax=Fluctibacter halophilus TaxID=226011 RepID=A0ABS8G4X5_9ALTE|nr:leucine-rich repeat domain-containing protein [Aestuariibacter halophilus]MCC2615191.1 leucine-rich repeat domain-containing protein [Aestuariibacter halophilus]
MQFSKFSQASVLAFTTAILSACGGSGGESTPTPTSNSKPTISPMSAQSETERGVITITASASDSDGSVTDYHWVQVSGPDASLENAETSSVSVVLPAVDESQTIVLALTITDNDGATAREEVSLTVEAADALTSSAFTDAGLAACFSELAIADQDVGLTELVCDGKTVGSLDDLSALPRLQRFEMHNGYTSAGLEFPALSELTHVVMRSNEMDILPDVSELALEYLDLSDNNIYPYYSTFNVPQKIGDQPTLKTLLLENAFITYSNVPLAPFSVYTSLETLRFSHVYLDSTTDLKALTQLKTLQLSNMRGGLVDLSILSSMPQLASLDVSSTKVVDLTVLTQLSALKELDISNTDVSNLDPVYQLSGLTKLTMSHLNAEIDFDKLGTLTELTDLDLSSRSLSSTAGMSSLTGLERLNLSGTNLSTLGFVETMSALTWLDISNNGRISDLSAVSKLTALNGLDISGLSNLSDLTPLQTLTQLETLYASDLYTSYYNPIDVSALSALTSLKFLDLHDNQLVNVDSLSSLAQLETLDLSTTGLSNLFDMSGMTALTTLSLRRNSLIVDLSPLADATSLTSLDIIELSNLTSLDGLETLTALTTLYAGYTDQLSDISALGQISGLTVLDLSRAKVADQLDIITAHTGLRRLSLSNTGLTDVSPLHSLTELQHLNLQYNTNILCDDFPALEAALSGTQIAKSSDCLEKPIDLSLFTDPNLHAYISDRNFKDAADVDYLYISNNGISSIAGLEQFYNLYRLQMNSNQISDLSPLSGMSNLRYLNANDNQISDLSPLSSLTRLYDLSVDNNQITDMSPLYSLTYLDDLSISNNRITALDGISGMSRLWHLNLQSNQLSDISPLLDMNRVRYLFLGGNEDIQCADVDDLEATNYYYTLDKPEHCL